MLKKGVWFVVDGHLYSISFSRLSSSSGSSLQARIVSCACIVRLIRLLSSGSLESSNVFTILASKNFFVLAESIFPQRLFNIFFLLLTTKIECTTVDNTNRAEGRLELTFAPTEMNNGYAYAPPSKLSVSVVCFRMRASQNC